MKNRRVQSHEEAPTAPFLRAVPMFFAFLCDYARRRRRGQMHVRLPLDMLLLPHLRQMSIRTRTHPGEAAHASREVVCSKAAPARAAPSLPVHSFSFSLRKSCVLDSAVPP